MYMYIYYLTKDLNTPRIFPYSNYKLSAFDWDLYVPDYNKVVCNCANVFITIVFTNKNQISTTLWLKFSLPSLDNMQKKGGRGKGFY